MGVNVRVLVWISSAALCGAAACGGPAEKRVSMTEVPFDTAPDKDLEAAILRASPSYTRDVVDAGAGSGEARYVFSRFDLDGDGQDEVFVYLLGSFFCDTGGCRLQLFTHRQDG